MAVLRSKEALRLCRGARAGPGGKRATACLTGGSEADAGSSVDPAWTEHRRACPGLDPGGPAAGRRLRGRTDFLGTFVSFDKSTSPSKRSVGETPLTFVLLHRLAKAPRHQRSGAQPVKRRRANLQQLKPDSSPSDKAPPARPATARPDRDRVRSRAFPSRGSVVRT